MEDKYFDKKIKGILESAPDLEPDELAVQDMRKRLKELPGRKRRSFLYLIPLLLVPFLMLGGFFYKKYSDLQKQLVLLNTEISTIKQYQKTDTIFEKTTIHHYDTIFNVIYREHYVKASKEKIRTYTGFQSPFYNQGLLYSETFYTPYILSRSLGKPSNSLFTFRPGSGLFNTSRSVLFPNELGIVPNPFTKKEEKIDYWSIAFSQLDKKGPFFLPPLTPEIPQWVQELEPDVPEDYDLKVKPAYYFIPNGIAAQASWNPAVILFDAFDNRGTIYGLGGGIRFPGGRSLNLGVELLNTDFEIKDMALFDQFPIRNPDDPTDVLAELKGNFSYLQVPVTMRQSFFNESKFKPFINIGFTAVRPIRQRFVYEYFNSSGEYSLSDTFRAGAFSVDHMRFGIGGEYEIFEKTSLLGEAIYQQGFSQGTGEYFKLRYFALNLGLRYNLN